MTKLSTIQQAAEHFGVSTQTLRRWERAGKIPKAQRTKGNQRRYDLSSFKPAEAGLKEDKLPTLAYAGVSSHDQKEDLLRQENMLSIFCVSQGWSFELLSDLGSGMNYHKRGLKQLIRKILNRNMSRLVLTHKDRLLRFGSELITVFSARLYGARSRKNKKLMEDLQKVVVDGSA